MTFIFNDERNDILTQFAFIIFQFSVLKLGENNFSGPIPKSLANFKNLQSLDLSGNDFTGAVPDELCEMTNLEGIKVDKDIECDPTCCFN